MIMQILAVALGGAIGALARFGISKIPFLTGHDFPWMTFAANFIGAVIIGMIAGLLLESGRLSSTQTSFLKTGFCGSLTTFSTFSLEALTLLESGKILTGSIYIIVSVILCIAGVLLGRLVAVKCFI